MTDQQRDCDDDPFHIGNALEQVAEAKARLAAFSYALESVSQRAGHDSHFSQAVSTIHGQLWREVGDAHNHLFQMFIMSRPELDQEMHKAQKTVFHNFLDDRKFHLGSLDSLTPDEKKLLIKRLRTRVFRLEELYSDDTK